MTETAHAADQAVEVGAARFVFRPTVFLSPDRLVHPPSWIEHIPFAFWLVDVMRPRLFVELGTQAGNSYAAFAQAIQHLGLNTAGYSIDTWKGDPQAGFYDESVFTEWKDYHDRHFSAFSTLVRSSFDDAVAHFADGSIDLLNIDGYHTFSSVRHDFETWLPRMSRRGIVLLHDINVRERDFGAWRVWQQLRGEYPTFEFLHGFGMGVVAVGSDLPAEIDWLVSADPTDSPRTAFIRRFFARIGSGILAQYDAAEAKRNVEAQLATERARLAQEDNARVAAHETAIRQFSFEVSRLQDRLSQLAGDLAERDARIAERDATIAERGAQLAGLDQRLATSVAERDAQIAELTARLAEAGRELTQRLTNGAANVAARDAQLADLTSRLERAEHQDDHGVLRAALDDRDARIAAFQQDIARRESVRISQQAVATLTSHALADANRHLAATKARARTLATAVDNLQPGAPRSRWARAWSTLRALGITPAQIAHRPRNASTMLRLALRPRALRDAHLITQSGLFDPAYYERTSPDVASTGVNSLAHFVITGGAEGRLPCALFDSAWYLATYPDVASAGANPLAHYLRAR